MAKKRKAKKAKIKRKRVTQKTRARKRSTRKRGVPAVLGEREKEQHTQAQFLRNAFEGMKGRQPKSDEELNQWLTTDEGKEATMFAPSSLSRWGETGRS